MVFKLGSYPTYPLFLRKDNASVCLWEETARRLTVPCAGAVSTCRARLEVGIGVAVRYTKNNDAKDKYRNQRYSRSKDNDGTVPPQFQFLIDSTLR